MFDKLFLALAKRRARRILTELIINNNFQCSEESLRFIIGACRLTRWSDEKIKEIVLNVGSRAA